MAPTWRIDELAQKAGLTVDTIRYYAREGLLPPPERAGPPQALRPRAPRAARADPRAPGQRFSLAAIRAVVDADRPGLEGLFADDATAATRSTSWSSGPASTRDARRPAARRRAAPRPRRVRRARPTTTTTSACCGRSPSSATIGMTPEILVELGAIYVDHFRALQHDVHDMLSGQDDRDWDPDELVAIQQQLTANSPRMIPAIDQRPQLRAPAHDPTPHARSRAHCEATRTGSAASASTDTTDRARVRARGPRCAPRCRRRCSACSSSAMPPIISSMTLREYGQSLPWCG